MIPKLKLGQLVRITRRGGILDPSHDAKAVYEIVRLVPGDNVVGYHVRAGAVERAVREDDIEDAGNVGASWKLPRARKS